MELAGSADAGLFQLQTVPNATDTDRRGILVMEEIEKKHEYKARVAGAGDIMNCVEWIHANRSKNHYDPDIFKYESTRFMAVDKDGTPDGYLPYQLVIMTDSFAPRPGRTLPELALILKEALHAIVRVAKQSRIGEVYFLCAPEDEETRKFAITHGYEELPFKVMRLKPRNMVPPIQEDKEGAVQ
jgi:hypothetical protein